MATVLSEFRGGLGQLFQRARLLTTVYRINLRSLAISSEGSSSGKSSESSSSPASPAQKEKPFDNTTYKVNEYYSYDENSFYDLECDIDATGTRQRQPDPSVPYKHTEPWKKEAKS